MDDAIYNPLILVKIFRHSSLSAKTLRLVCHTWNDVVVSMITPKLRFRFQSPNESGFDCCDPIHFRTFTSSMEPKLARSVSIYEQICVTGMHGRLESLETAISRFRTFFSNFSPTVVDLTITIVPYLAPVLFEIFQKYLPNLKHLQIRDGIGNWINRSPLLTVTPHLLRPNLECFQVLVEQNLANNIMSTLAQLVINSAPNLTKLTLPGDYNYTKLTPCRLLSRVCVVIRPGDGLCFDKVFKMLSQIRDSVEDIEFKRNFAHDGVTQLGEVSLSRIIPGFKKLAHFRNYLVDLVVTNYSGDVRIRKTLAQIGRRNSLQISAGEKNDKSVDSLLLTTGFTGWRKLLGLWEQGIIFASLSLEGLHDPKHLSGLKIHFASLEKLSVRLDAFPLELGKTLEACQTLGVTHLVLVTYNFTESLTGFLTCFRDNICLFDDVKIFEVICRPLGRIKEDELSMEEIEAFKQLLTDMEGKEIISVVFSNIPFKPRNWNVISSFSETICFKWDK